MGGQAAELNNMVKIKLTDALGSEQRLKEVRKREEYSRQQGHQSKRPKAGVCWISCRDSKEAGVGYWRH